MEYISLKDILNAVDGKLLQNGQLEKFNHITIDTREVKKNSIFIAIKGEKYNANEFLIEAIKNGASLCIIDEIKYNEADLPSDVSIIVVEDTRKALLNLAEFYKSILNIKVVGITGSTGKTSTKDMTYAILSEKYKVYKTQGNFNNEIGLPLTIFNLDNTYDIAVLEMGMSHFFEIHNMAKTAKPDIAIITNIGISHIENLKTRDNILKAKLEITDYFIKSSKLIINTDNELLEKLSIKDINYDVVRCGSNINAELKAYNICLGEDYVTFDILEDEKVVFRNFRVNSPGKHNVLNALLAIAAARNFGMTWSEMNSGIKKLQMTSMRLDILRGSKYTIIDDCYNASPDSMRAAIDVLHNVKGTRKIAILGSMRELGEEAFKAHVDVGVYAKENSIDFLIILGEFSLAYEQGFSDKDKLKNFDSNENVIKFLKNFLNKDDVILVKASRAMKFEQIVKDIKEDNK
ncbi:UDP-N-acetylmuramoyl-tripeptide--D-alanyl-D-alanine ligase [Clostridium akagii]|uniref:UDP-N-acetylmuramoyl-tripeptide--D-alanyl-D- alanine ligase n=1 Tax=Clostridium akagii TaxID=91623 RepID=UPI00047A30B2|nr:UDP-N-acetylmuramoyl-tripeptide--D-alanyl-D-alanine ligase [Clostridium akagii]